ncbi:hypothetical protein IQ269_15175 [Tychonema sp. LEGE 07199]|uniref:hypothetical protein n=1 Tax=unclassified Tychonema TaxID=2642144 RepID=UPI001881DF42|nr:MULTISPECIES: hypothetical protein [unclassified Tychonema]MBE9122113.1 hypothetical protein [Tychonema sp. LEGE 07199]MBE9134307.1 hypothetical protein [Tychonema sp. LEGE 07196]
MLDDDKDFDKTLTKIMVGGALLTNALVFAVGFDTGYQSGAKRVPEPTIIHGNVTINNSINLNSDDAGSVSK